jgi:hypothetical protein
MSGWLSRLTQKQKTGTAKRNLRRIQDKVGDIQLNFQPVESKDSNSVVVSTPFEKEPPATLKKQQIDYVYSEDATVDPADAFELGNFTSLNQFVMDTDTVKDQHVPQPPNAPMPKRPWPAPCRTDLDILLSLPPLFGMIVNPSAGETGRYKVTKITNNSAAIHAGLRVGDELVTLFGMLFCFFSVCRCKCCFAFIDVHLALFDDKSFHHLLKSVRPTDLLPLTIWRDDKTALSIQVFVSFFFLTFNKHTHTHT